MMVNTVIKVENLSKRYRIGLKEARKDTLFAQIGYTLTAPIRNFKRLRNMTRFREDDESVFWALKDINFEVQQGEVLGIIGHNGAGKSTLLKLLSRITEPTTGNITLKGRVAALLEVGTGFHPDLTGRENIFMNGTILGMTKKEIDHKLDEIIEFSGIEKYIDTPVKFYSSGMKVRLGFSVAAYLEPEILIIDEVLAVGDAEFQKKCLGKMEDVANSGRTVLFVSHDMGAMLELTKRCLLLVNGVIVDNDSTSRVVKKYLDKRSTAKLENIINLSVIKEFNLSVKTITQETLGMLIFGKDYLICGSFTSNIDLKHAYIFLRIEDDDGNIITTINSKDNGFSIKLLKDKKTNFSYYVEKLNFLPGEYIITFALHDSFSVSIETIYHCYSFKISNQNIPDRLKKKSKALGKTYLFGKWTN